MTDKQHHQRKKRARQAQMKAQTNRDKARSKLLQQRRELARRRAENRKQCEERRAEADDERESPTKHSTLPPQMSNAQNAARNSHSTVPAAPKCSTVPARERLYGLRLHRKVNEHTLAHEQADEEVSSDG